MRLALALVLCLNACGDDMAPPMLDGSVSCTSDAQCDDRLFCNGAEVCDPTSAAASSFGCVAAESPCPPGACSEEMRRCADADCADDDGDGHRSAMCGGDDCDDADPDRYPGRTERCDFVDDDCDPLTLGDRDVDGDGFVSAFCCNGDLCGDDCDDDAASVNRTAPEVCDLIDQDCDGNIDEGVAMRVWPDSDRDGYGDSESSAEVRCDRPSDRASRDGDCNDLDADVNPDEPEICDGVDQDCDGTIDEGTDSLCDAALGTLTVGACVTPPGGGLPRCHGLRCADGASTCADSANNVCDANLCMSRVHCGECDSACLDCVDGYCPGGGGFIVPYRFEVRDLETGAAVPGAPLSAVGACDSTFPPSDAMGNLDIARDESDSLFEGLRLEVPGALPTVVRPVVFGTNPIAVLQRATYDGWLVDAGVTQDPELGVVIFVVSLGLDPIVDFISDPPFDVAGTSERTIVYPNVLPGSYTVAPLPTGCTGALPCERVTRFLVEGGTLSVRYFDCGDGLSCSL